MNHSNHYGVLGVEENATFTEIKSAHRKKALKFHPDKSSASSLATASEGDGDNAESAFQRIQIAWECLRDERKRSKYDDSLRRIREKNSSMLSKAESVKLSEMTCELCDVEDEEEDQHLPRDPQKLYCYDCRCGDVFEILEEDLKQESNLWECQSCGLSIHIVTNSTE